ncbi:MAG: hypothetical protein LBP29_02445, partial [Treponema sp.]|nr:hypothetical protein [Treponema sp.]
KKLFLGAKPGNDKRTENQGIAKYRFPHYSYSIKYTKIYLLSIKKEESSQTKESVKQKSLAKRAGISHNLKKGVTPIGENNVR